MGWVVRLVPGNLVMISFPFALRARLLSFQLNDNNQPCERLCLLARRWWNISQSKLLWKQREIRVMRTKVVSWLIAVWRWLMECWHSSLRLYIYIYIHILNENKFGIRYSAVKCFLINKEITKGISVCPQNYATLFLVCIHVASSLQISVAISQRSLN